ncbi:Panacea domain-containing protein [Oceanibacterium hippocampi]|uniref:Antitoxin SocA-like Panacea domain-containing protein n=1 Tax=Oceanibacterium hippocampi TaxID=745714 RepID=A0A1Y5U4Q5_9PROT|nr:hypothetical protein [Oceanibacterium hippocampi]SLN76917.1 hypothetical protein OCH7691_04233 [Oceanibacterium hippocampi]
MRPGIRSVFDVAQWFIERNRSTGRSLPAAKLHCLIYESQLRYAIIHKGARMMPATFLATELGPIEPNLYLIYDGGEAPIAAMRPSEQVASVLEAVWHDLGERSAEQLAAHYRQDPAYLKAWNTERSAEIALDDMVQCRAIQISDKVAPLRADGATPKTGPRAPVKPAAIEAAPDAGQSIRFTGDGRVVTRWRPTKTVRRLH